MSKPDFSTMTTKKLKTYVLQHRDDDDAVHALVNRVQQNGVLVESDEHFR